jgi:predicted MFS family arabinose efflux permease
MTNSSEAFTGYQKILVAILAFLQFTIVLDFMILAPLGAILMPTLQITTGQFGAVVSAYAFSAGASGLLAAGFADRFDRKKLLLFFYSGFILGTFLCGIATTYSFLLFARIVTGIFGGVIGSIVFAITTDLFSFSQRGRVMGFVQTAFAASQILGLPVGLYLANQWGWHSAFQMIVITSLLVGVVIILVVKPINAHLRLRPDRSAVHHLIDTLTRRDYLQAFATTALMSTGGFMLMPFSSAFSVNNLGIGLDRLPMVYLITGACNIVAGPVVGRLSDKLGKLKMFMIGSSLGIVMVFIYTNLGITPIGIVILVSVLMFTTIMSRMISALALMSAIPDSVHRGSFMSVSSSVQQISGGIAAAFAGLIVVQSSSGHIEHFDILGYVVIGASMITMVMMFFINRMVLKTKNLK